MVQVIGHRGCSFLEPENTLRGFKRAVKMGVDYVELDVHVCLSGELVVIHDPTLERTTNGSGQVYDHTLDELKKLDAGKGERIPTLDEVLKVLDNKVKIIIELKGPYTEKATVDLVKKHTLVHNVVISSFVNARLGRVKKLDPNLRIAYTLNRISSKKVVQMTLPSQIHVRRQFVSAALLEAAHTKGIEVFAWTANTKTAIKKLVSMGVDGVITDDPGLVD